MLLTMITMALFLNDLLAAIDVDAWQRIQAQRS
jgi:hypothetical protein